MKHRVVITGLGVTTALGKDKDTFWNNLMAGKSGITPIEGFDVSAYTTRIAGQVHDFNPEDYLERKEARKLDRFVQFAVAATAEALKDSKLNVSEDTDPERVGVIIGSGIGGLGTFEDQHSILLEKGPKRVSPFFIPMMIANMASGQVSIIHGAKGPNVAPVTACASGSHAIGDAFKFIQSGEADVMITGGAEATIRPTGLAGFCSMRAMSTRNDDPTTASRPFDTGRDGFVMAEGSGILILESLEHAQKRGAHIYAEVIGYGLSADAFHMTEPNPDGPARCMKMAMRTAGIQPEDVQYINAHGTSTPVGDKSETKAIKMALGDHASRIAVSSTKSMTGHLLGAAGGVEAVICALSLQHQIIAPTINLHDQDPECDLDYVPNVARKADLNIVMSNSFGFGGHNASIVLKKFEA
ncbi:beta-ketoacyl-ACP synthase II [Paenibacillus hunanensis]|uniref:3-oxoacyl-[acyl-carrier-protein] synthase 2 n=1 Tax=Paenibacillus hunanensis TaxID=539262 RepID=A0ABU1IZS7_9BACL|nr:beta-ketoacyl-ACP synthase II [Paenibacillus hunanensis]MCL9663547.1 beta-ketoacyl-ACP synthase II [Paenibacillus hunanensis]MDR6244765.1 3-oxoacyl-[acyl-carrier-protein] synthase II [Paenibacillus hunanensis]WPP39895.1 beta-ketoacyl-ACP synthase II [Paenibacillus hunanensis]GGJ21623.1 3-oxoacyl-[acyl-carrier-protein] synthase 2 [Paenibacillus hunanensis]